MIATMTSFFTTTYYSIYPSYENSGGVDDPRAIIRLNCNLVADFKNWLKSENKTDYLDIVENIIRTIEEWKKKRRHKDKVDIEMLLEAIEKIENRDQDILSHFYNKNTFTLSNCKCYDFF